MREKPATTRSRGRQLLRWTSLVPTTLLVGCQANSVALTSSGGDPEQGAKLAWAYGCGTCHVIPGVAGADATVGPPLTAWAHRSYIAGTLPNQPGPLIRWLMDPQRIEPGTAMPDLGVTEPQARHIAAFLYTLR